MAKSGWSKKQTDFFGRKYIQHYDEHGNKAGWSQEKQGLFGKHTQRYDQSGEKKGYSEKKHGLLGEYTQHHDQGGAKTGWSEKKQGLFGRYKQHYEQGGAKAGWSEKKQGLSGAYMQNHDTSRKKDSDPRHRDSSEKHISEYAHSEGDRVASDRVGSVEYQASPAPPAKSGDARGRKGSLGKTVLKGFGYAVAATVVLGLLASVDNKR